MKAPYDDTAPSAAQAGKGAGRHARVVALLPAWNAEAFIEATLNSLAAQTYPNLHILISDDRSTDRTAEICREFCRHHHNAALIEQPENLGWVGNTNALLGAAHGDYFFFAFHDDVLANAYVAKTVAALDVAPHAVLAFSDVVVHRDGAVTKLGVYKELEAARTPHRRASRLVRRKGHWFAPFRGVFRSGAASQLGGLQKHRRGEYESDWVWLVRLSLLGDFIRVPEPLCDKHYKPESLSLSRRWPHDSDAKEAVTAAVMRAVWNSGLPWLSKMALVAQASPRWSRHVLLGAMGRILPRRPSPAMPPGGSRRNS